MFIDPSRATSSFAIENARQSAPVMSPKFFNFQTQKTLSHYAFSLSSLDLKTIRFMFRTNTTKLQERINPLIDGLKRISWDSKATLINKVNLPETNQVSFKTYTNLMPHL